MATDTYDAYDTYSFSKSAIASPLFILKIMLDTQTRPGRAHTTYHTEILSEMQLEPKLLTHAYIWYIRCVQLYTWYI